MIGKLLNQEQKDLFLPNLCDFINPKHELCLLSDKIVWNYFETEFASLYSKTGQPAKPIRLMVGLLILKQVYNLADETVVEEWVSNPYFQYFCGEMLFQWKFPCDPSDLVHFRHRIGENGIEKILGMSILLHGKKVLSEAASIDTTAQPKNITYPTDTKLAVKIIKKCRKMAKDEEIELRQSYTFVAKELLLEANSKSPKKAKERASARRKIKTIAGRLTREMRRKLGFEISGKHHETLGIFEQVLNQKKDDKNKIYSLHALEVACIAKGKEHRKYEFGSKVSFATAQKSNVILSAVNFKGNPNDNKTLKKTLEQIERITGKKLKEAYVDRGYKTQEINGTKIYAPSNGKGKTNYEKSKLRKAFRRRAGIEPIIGHAKSDYGMDRNYLKGEVGDAINAMLAAAAFNFRSWMRKAVEQLIFILKYIKLIWYQSTLKLETDALGLGW
jgi:transposase, IS5 family